MLASRLCMKKIIYIIERLACFVSCNAFFVVDDVSIRKKYVHSVFKE